MRVILLKEVAKLGKPGDVKTVSDGHARNFLIPRGLAQAATEQNLKAQAKRKADRDAEAIAERRAFEKLLEQLQSEPLRFTMKVGEKGQAFGSISAQDIVESLAKRGVRIEKSWLDLEHGIKTTGKHDIPVKFPHGIEGKLDIVVAIGE